MNTIAAQNDAPAWSRGLSTSPRCAINQTADSVNSPTITVTSDTVVDARTVASGCTEVALHAMSLALASDLTLVVDNVKITGGLTLTTADGGDHTLRIISPNGTVKVTSGIASDASVTTQIATGSQLTINGPATMYGQVTGGSVAITGAVDLQYRPIVTPGVSIE